MVNNSVGYKNVTIFHHSAEPTAATPNHLLPTSTASTDDAPVGPTPKPPASKHLTTAADRQSFAEAVLVTRLPDSELEGALDDPAGTKVVDRRWYERNKHIYPASTWEEFDSTRDYSKGTRKDGEGNAYFFSR